MTYDTIGDAVTMQGSAGGTLLAGRYRVVRQLGQGGMGSVWLAEDTQLDNKPFAIKMLPSILVSNKRAYRQLKDEALVAMKLTHPNIVTLRAFEENNGNPFLVMDYIEGQTLDDYLAEKGKLSEDEVIRVLRPIAAALDYAHGEGVVHRDVKPANVMIRNDGHPFILDFGIAREIQETMTRVTGKLSSGTLLYMSPEQLMGEKPTPAQDIYSFAAMVYECLKGEPPFSHGQIEFQIMNKVPEPLTGCTGLSALLAVGVMVGLVKKPEGRPVTCAAVLRVDDSSRAEHVERVGRAQTPVTPPIGSCVPQDRPAERSSSATEGMAVPMNPPHQGGALKALVAAAAIAFVVVGGWWYANQKQESVRAAEQRAEEARSAEEARRRAGEAEIRKAEVERKATEATERQTIRARTETERRGAERAAEERVRLAAEAAARAAATEIRIEAIFQKANVERISDADGFKEKKDALVGSFARADALFDEKTGRWSEAAVLFTNFVNQCKALAVLDGERQSAVAKRVEAQAAFRRAEEAGAKTCATTRWNEAVSLWQNADIQFKGMEFTAAGDRFASAARQFAQSEKDVAAERKRRAKWRKEGEQFTINDPYGLNLTMKWCPAGTFTMGSPVTEEGRFNNEVQHEVKLTKGFWMGETEVTQGQWRRIMDGETIADLERKALLDDTEYMIGGKKQTIRASFKHKSGTLFGGEDTVDQLPVYWVSWYEAVRFCQRLTQREFEAGRLPDGYEYRLPTEAEWEYACRAGTSSALPNGKNLNVLGVDKTYALDDIAWHSGNARLGKGSSRKHVWGHKLPDGTILALVPQEVKGKRANNWGLYDMIGNMYEWCCDGAADYPSGTATDPMGGTTGECRIFRGGSWLSDVRRCRSAARGWDVPDIRSFYLSFRVALASGRTMHKGETGDVAYKGNSNVNDDIKAPTDESVVGADVENDLGTLLRVERNEGAPKRESSGGHESREGEVPHEQTRTQQQATVPAVNGKSGVNYTPYINTPTGKMYVDAEVECPGAIVDNMGKDTKGRWVFSVSTADGTVGSLQGRVVRFQYNGKKGKKFVSASDVGKQIDVVLE